MTATGTTTTTGRIHLLQHSMVSESLTALRRRTTPVIEFRQRIRMIARSLAYESTRDLPVESVEVETPICRTTGVAVRQRVIVAPILRAGLGMLEGFLEVVPQASTGFIGLKRDETTLLPREYFRNYPQPSGAHFFLLDPMLATGGSVLAALRELPFRSIASVTLLSILAAPEGLEVVTREFPELRIFTAAIDERLDERGYIVPGLGDAGDRLCDTC